MLAQWVVFGLFLIIYPIASIIKLISNKSKFNNKGFINEFGVLIEGMRIRNPYTVFVYPAMIIYRLIFSFIPNIFIDQPGLQFIILT